MNIRVNVKNIKTAFETTYEITKKRDINKRKRELKKKNNTFLP